MADAGAGAGVGSGAAESETKSTVADGYEYATPQLKDFLVSHSVDRFIAAKPSDLVRGRVWRGASSRQEVTRPAS